MLFKILFCAFVLSVPELPQSEHADTEASTNIPVTVRHDEITRLSFVLSLDASPTNAVEVSIGADLDDDGDLSLDEFAYTFGYDCGKWFSRRAARDRLDVSDAGTGRISHEFILHRSRLDSTWNLVKVTRRGTPATAELTKIVGSHPGLLLMLR